MVGWHHELGGHEFDQAPGDGDGQGSQACCSPWGYMTKHVCMGVEGDGLVAINW